MSVSELGKDSECRRITISTNSIIADRIYNVDSGNPEAAIDDIQLPKLGSEHPTRPGLYVTTIDVSKASPDTCKAIITWSREGYATGDLEQDEEETEIAAEEETHYTDLDHNVLGESGLSVYAPRMILTRTLYRSFFDRSTVEDLCGKINKYYFAGKKKGLWLYLGATGRKVGNQKHMIVHRFLYNPMGHHPWAPSFIQEEYEEEGQTLTRWVCKPDPENPDECEYLRRRIYKEGNFSLLGAGT